MFSIPISKSPPHPRYTILDSRVPTCNAISEGQGRLPLCSASSEAGALPSEVRIEDDSDRKLSKSKILSGPSPREFFLKINEIPDCYPAKHFLNYLL